MLVSILLALALLQEIPVTSQPEIPQHPEVQFHVFTPPADLDITLADVIDILTDYEFLQDDKGVLKYLGYHGMTAPEIKKIFVASQPDMATRRDTVIHELLHVILWKRGYDSRGPLWEYFIAQKTNEIYQKIYVSKPKAETQAPIQAQVDTQPPVQK